MDLYSSHQGKSGGLVGASGVLADSVGIMIGTQDQKGTDYVIEGYECLIKKHGSTIVLDRIGHIIQL